MENIIFNVLAIIGLFVVGYLLLLKILKVSDDSKNQEKREIELIKNSPECRELGYSNNLQVSDMLTRPSYRKELMRLIKVPEIRNLALENVREIEKNKHAEKQELINKRKIGYKYENEIFEIFDTYYKLTQDEIINGFMKRFSTNQTKATEIFQECHNNWLIIKVNTIIPTDEVFYKVGFILDSDEYKLTQNDLTRKEWLKKNNKVLEHRINLENDLPF